MRGVFSSHPSITTRLIVGLTLVTTLLWCAAATYSIVNSYRELNEAFDQTLQEAARRLLPLAADAMLGHEQDDAIATRDFIEGRKDYLSYQLSDAQGRILLRSEDAPLEPFAQARQDGFSTVGNFRLFTYTDAASNITLIVAETTAGRWHAIVENGKAMLWPLVALIPFNMLAIWFGVRGAMTPVLRLSADIATRGGANLAPLDISGLPAELQPIATATARLVERLKSALDAERALAANSAHELRTPIAGALAQTQRMITQLQHPADRARARDIETSLKRLSALAEKLMQLSRADAGFGASEKSVDLLPVLDVVVSDSARLLSDPTRIRYAKGLGTRLVARMDMDAFAIAARNLIDNALNHGVAGGTIDVIVEPGGIVRVLNDCEIVPPSILEELKHRFFRGTSRVSGSGLGLSIVEMIMAQSGGEVVLLSPVPGTNRGFEARLQLPV